MTNNRFLKKLLIYLLIIYMIRLITKNFTIINQKTS